jgi:phospholipase C
MQYLSFILLPSLLLAEHPIKHVVHIMMVVQLTQENRAFDTIFGYLNHTSDIDNLVNKQFCNLADVNDPHSEQYCTGPVQPQTSAGSPDHGLDTIAFQLYGGADPKQFQGPAPMNGFVHQARIGAYRDNQDKLQEIISGFHPSSIPIHSTLAEEFMVCDRWFASVPGPTQPNRAFVHTATSDGLISNDRGRLIPGLPQRTIFEDILESGLEWKSYFAEVPSLAFLRQIRFALFPRSRTIDHFFTDAREGTLQSYNFLEPYYSELRHDQPTSDGSGGHDFREAEKLLKNIYEALRNGPQWNSTLLLVTYDEHGGFYDHVPPPTNIPNPEGKTTEFDFQRLGVRVPVLMISPWLKKGSGIVVDAVLHKPNGPFYNSEYEHSSLPATLRKILGLKGICADTGNPLTKREEWAGTFDDIFLDAPRGDTPTQLPRIAI